MKNKKYLWIIVMAVALGSAILAGCGPGGTEFTYRVAGTASEATIKYTNADGELEETTANLPWEKTLTLGNEFSFDLTVTNQSDSGTVTCEALVDGKVLGEADSNTSVSCSGYFSKKGDSLTSAFSSAAAPSAGEHLNRGVEYAKQGQLDKAIAEFEEAIKLDPNYVEAHVNLGIAYAKQGMFDKAIAAYEEAIRLDPNVAEAHYNLGNAYAEQGMLDKAIAEYEEALKLNPDDVDTHFNLGLAYAEQGMFDKAIVEYEEALKLNPDNVDTHYNLGGVYHKQGQVDKAITEYKEAIRLDPNIAEVHYDLGIAYFEQGQVDEAIAEFEEAIELDPEYVKAHINLGSAYYKQGKLDEAIAEYQEVVRIDPDFAEAHKGLGIVYRDLGMPDKAIAEFETYLQLRPDAPDKKAAQQEIAKLKESAARQAPEYRNAVGGYSLLYPKGWYYTESETQVEFAESKAAYEAGIDEYSIVLFTAVPLTKLAEDLGLTEITEPVSVWEAMAESFGAETGEIETFEIAGYPTAAADISGTYKGTPCRGGLAVVLVGERGIIAFNLAPPDQWEAFRPTFAAMLNSLSFFEP